MKLKYSQDQKYNMRTAALGAIRSTVHQAKCSEYRYNKVCAHTCSTVWIMIGVNIIETWLIIIINDALSIQRIYISLRRFLFTVGFESLILGLSIPQAIWGLKSKMKCASNINYVHCCRSWNRVRNFSAAFNFSGSPSKFILSVVLPKHFARMQRSDQ